MEESAIVARLEEAGATLLALPGNGYHPHAHPANLDIVRTAAEIFSDDMGRPRAPVPSAVQITLMDEALGWIPLIPQDRYVLRRIVGARALVHPLTKRHLYSWTRLGTLLGVDHKAVQRWHAQGVAIIAKHLAPPPSSPKERRPVMITLHPGHESPIVPCALPLHEQLLRAADSLKAAECVTGADLEGLELSLRIWARMAEHDYHEVRVLRGEVTTGRVIIARLTGHPHPQPSDAGVPASDKVVPIRGRTDNS